MRKIEKPWGYELVWAETDRYVGKILHINQGEQLSLQYHEVKDETLFLSTGRLELEVGKMGSSLEVVNMEPGDARHIPPGMVHRMLALEASDVFEVSTPHLDDVVRLQDRYGRVGDGALVQGEDDG